jgi:hypothetical protein
MVQPGFVVSHRFFVVKGVFRSYVIDKKGQGKTVSLAIDNWFITDANSYLYQQPASMLIEALEERIILQLSHKDEQKRSAHTYKFETFRRHQLEITLACIQRRRIPDLTLIAEEILF